MMSTSNRILSDMIDIIRIRIRIRPEIWKQIWYRWYPSISDPFSSLFKSDAFQLGSLSAIFPSQGKRSDFGSFLFESGSPKYVHGNSTSSLIGAVHPLSHGSVSYEMRPCYKAHRLCEDKFHDFHLLRILSNVGRLKGAVAALPLATHLPCRVQGGPWASEGSVLGFSWPVWPDMGDPDQTCDT